MGATTKGRNVQIPLTRKDRRFGVKNIPETAAHTYPTQNVITPPAPWVKTAATPPDARQGLSSPAGTRKARMILMWDVKCEKNYYPDMHIFKIILELKFKIQKEYNFFFSPPLALPSVEICSKIWSLSKFVRGKNVAALLSLKVILPWTGIAGTYSCTAVAIWYVSIQHGKKNNSAGKKVLL